MASETPPEAELIGVCVKDEAVRGAIATRLAELGYHCLFADQKLRSLSLLLQELPGGSYVLSDGGKQSDAISKLGGRFVPAQHLPASLMASLYEASQGRGIVIVFRTPYKNPRLLPTFRNSVDNIIDTGARVTAPFDLSDDDREKPVSVGFKLTPSVRAEFESYAKAEGMTLTEWLRRAAFNACANPSALKSEAVDTAERTYRRSLGSSRWDNRGHHDVK